QPHAVLAHGPRAPADARAVRGTLFRARGRPPALRPPAAEPRVPAALVRAHGRVQHRLRPRGHPARLGAARGALPRAARPRRARAPGAAAAVGALPRDPVRLLAEDHGRPRVAAWLG